MQISCKSGCDAKYEIDLLRCYLDINLLSFMWKAISSQSTGSQDELWVIYSVF